MKALTIDGFGNPGQALLSDVETNNIASDEVKVRIEAASVNPLDLKILAGYMQSVMPITLPYTVGTDFAGLVEEVGAQVNNIKVGERVFGRLDPSKGGAVAEFAIAPSNDVYVIPASMSIEQAAALPTAAGTAFHALNALGNIKSGQRVLIHAGAGGVGSFAIQFAKLAGAYVISTASERNFSLLKDLGADELINYRQSDFSDIVSDVDLVIDSVGGDTLERSWKVVKKGGTIVSLVEFSIESKSDIKGVFCFFDNEALNASSIIDAFEDHGLQVVLDKIYPMGDARASLEQLAGGHAKGKIVVRVI